MPFDLEKEALLTSGVTDNDRMALYSSKVNDLHQSFTRQARPARGLLNRARELFDWLWRVKPSRYEPGGNYRLTDVIDAQTSRGSTAVGNCLGLTLLYNVLLRRGGIEAEALWLENAFGAGPHVLTLLPINDAMVDVENSLTGGFDYKGHLRISSRKRWGDKDLVADIYHSLGNEFFDKGELNEAMKCYNMAINLNPKYERAHLNRMILSEKMGQPGMTDPKRQ
jgi:tetratricopeptide (TPR) repeat protein